MAERADMTPPRSFEELRERALEHVKRHGRSKVGVAAAEDSCALEAAHDAWEIGLVEPVLVGDPKKVATSAESVGVDISKWRMVPSPDPVQSGKIAVELVRKGEVDFLMKGKLNTADLMHAALDKETGIRAGKLMSHVAIVSTPEFGRLLCMSDGGIVMNPTLDDKVDIIKNAVDAMHKMGWGCPNVAIVCALELVNPKMPQTVDAAALSKMNDRGQITGCVIDGPFGFDNAVSEVAAERKGLKSPIAGKADLVIFSDIDVGNVFYKALYFMTDGVQNAGVLVGAKVPIVMPSRADGPDTKRNSIIAGAVIAQGFMA
jgi:phosphate butyryltransferase